MAVKLENLTDKPFWLRLNSGVSICIAPRAWSNELPAHEVADNAQIDKLVQRGTLARSVTAVKEPGDKQRVRRSEGAA